MSKQLLDIITAFLAMIIIVLMCIIISTYPDYHPIYCCPNGEMKCSNDNIIICFHYRILVCFILTIITIIQKDILLWKHIIESLILILLFCFMMTIMLLIIATLVTSVTSGLIGLINFVIS